MNSCPETPYERVVLVANPMSKNPGRAAKIIDHLDYANIPVELAETKAAGVEATMDLLEEHQVCRGDVVGIAGGDGTVNMIMEALMHRETPASRRKVPILPLLGGNANDFANSLNSGRMLNNPRAILQKGQEINIRPISCNIKNEESEQQYRAAYCATLGATALIADMLNHPNHRNRFRFPKQKEIEEAVLVFSNIPLLKRFEYVDNDTGIKHEAIEEMFVNGPRVGKYGRFHVEPHQPEMQHITVDNIRPKTVASSILRLMTGNMPFQKVKAGDSRNWTIITPTFIQFDGEAIKLEQQSELTIGLDEESFVALSTRYKSR